MTAGVTLQTKLSIAGGLEGTAAKGSMKLKLDDILESLELTPGTNTTGKADLLYTATRTVNASSNEDLDLAGALANAFGATITAAEIVLIFIKAAAGNTNNVNVSRPASNGFAGPFLAAGDGVKIAPGEWAVFQSKAGWAVTAGTGDLLNVANSGAGSSVSYDILIVGRTVVA